MEVRLRPVESGSSADAPSSVELTVADTGIGISDEDKKHVFDRFFQADNHVEQPYGGSGIGLSLTKDFVLLHGGSISVEDNAGGGTLFRVLLPLMNASLADLRRNRTNRCSNRSNRCFGRIGHIAHAWQLCRQC